MKNTNTKTLTRVALLVAIELVMKLVGLGSVPVGPLYMSFLTLPIAVGAITMGPAVGALLGGVFGAVSFYDAITGASAMTGALFQVSPLNTFILCVGMRVLMGLCCGLIFKVLQKLDKSRTWSYILSAMTAPALNTLFFMGYIVLAFYGCDYVQNLVSVKGAANPFMFVVLLVGVQGVAEFLVSGILGGIGGMAYIVPAVGEWNFEMGVAGMGFLALAVMIFGQWKPLNIAGAALFFAVFRAMANIFDSFGFLARLGWPKEIYNMMPFVASMVVLAFTSRKSRAPKAEGVPYDKGSR